MTVYQFAYRESNIMTRKDDDMIMLSRAPHILDCRDYMKGCFSVSATRNHPNFTRCVNDGLAIHKETGAVAVGCQQGKHRSRAVAQEILKRLAFDGVCTTVVRL